MTTSKTTRYPWDDLACPSHQGEYIAKLVPEGANPQHRKIYWAKSQASRPALLVEYECQPWKPISLPTFKNILVVDHQIESSLVIELLDSDMRDVFLKVCVDIIASLQNIGLKAIRKACIFRLEKWSSFLRPSRSSMSPEAQKGLIAELHFLKRDALSVYTESDAIRGWTGPDAGPRDFAFGQVFVEVKSKRSSANPNIAISSEDQLNINDTERLFLYVAELNDASSDDEQGFTVTDAVNETREALESPLQRAALDSKLASVGYFDEDDYSDVRWSEGSSYYYEVVDGFPRIDSPSCMPGVSRVSYLVNLDYCEDYLVDRQQVIEAME